MKLGMVGLGRMGGAMATRLGRHGHEVVGYDRATEFSEVDSLEGLVAALDGERRRVVWLMVPTGDPTDRTIAALATAGGYAHLGPVGAILRHRFGGHEVRS